ncbi:MAG: ImmA/IrrE family metallo-endopeptidase [Deltaproteobacteria bacterium]|nr:ImmA/IrrE family metallo-endopeptidase [Deltaproteobacteria bacterium]
MARGSRKRAELAAADLLTRVGATRPEHIDPVLSAKTLGIEVAFGQLAGATARICHNGRKARIRVSDQIVLAGRAAFSIAHELGHYLLGHTIASEHDERTWAHATCDRRPVHEEREADVFASTHTMPEAMVRAHCDLDTPNLYAARAVARLFPASPVASARRVIDLSPATCAVVYSETGRVRWIHYGRRFRARIFPGTRLHVATLARAHFDGVALEHEPRALPVASWIPRAIDAGTILEHAEVVPELGWGGVLSMLSMPPETSARAPG